jgi:hypothetical protein
VRLRFGEPALTGEPAAQRCLCACAVRRELKGVHATNSANRQTVSFLAI